MRRAVTVLALAVAMTGCAMQPIEPVPAPQQTAEYHPGKEHLPEDLGYTFTRVDHDAWWEAADAYESDHPGGYAFHSALCKDGANEGDYALMLGRIWAVFGEPDDPALYEDFYCYDLAAEDADGQVIVLEIYHGAAGPSICAPVPMGDDDEPDPDVEAAVKALRTLVKNTPPAAYTWGNESGYEDYDISMTYTYQDGLAKASWQ